MLPDRVSNPGPLTYESGALPTALRGPAEISCKGHCESFSHFLYLVSYSEYYYPLKCKNFQKLCDDLRFYVTFNSFSVISGR